MSPATQERVYAECLAQWNLRQVGLRHHFTLPPYMDWEDVRQMVMVRLWSRIHLWSPRRGPRVKWINRVMTMSLAWLRPYRNPS